MEEYVDVEVQEFDGKEYMLCKTVDYNNDLFDVFGNIDNPDDIKVFKQIAAEDGVYYEPATFEDKLNVIALFNPENN